MTSYRTTTARCLVLAAIVGYSPLACKGGLIYPDFKKALADDNVEKVESAMDGVAVDSPIGWWFQRTPLHIAAKEGAVNTVRMLIGKCIEGEINIAELKDRDGATPLHLAVRYGRQAVVVILMEANPKLAIVDDKQQYLPLHRAIKDPIQEVSEQAETALENYMVLQGTRQRPVSGQGATQEQVEVDRDKLVEYLFPDPDKFHKSVPPKLKELGEMIRQRKEELDTTRGEKDTSRKDELTQDIDKLSNEKKDLEDRREGWRKWAEEMVQAMVRFRVERNLRLGRDGYAPIHLVAENGTPGAALHILDRGEHMLNSYGTGGCTPLHLAAKGKQSEIVEKLLNWLKSKEVDEIQKAITYQDNRGRTLLHYATACPKTAEKVIEALKNLCGESDLIALLLTKKDKNRRTPLHEAASHGHLKVVKLLEKQGADINAKDKFGLTPLDLSTNQEVINHLLGGKRASYTPLLQRIVNRLRKFRECGIDVIENLSPEVEDLECNCSLCDPGCTVTLPQPCNLLAKILCCANNGPNGNTTPHQQPSSPSLVSQAPSSSGTIQSRSAGNESGQSKGKNPVVPVCGSVPKSV